MPQPNQALQTLRTQRAAVRPSASFAPRSLMSSTASSSTSSVSAPAPRRCPPGKPTARANSQNTPTVHAHSMTGRATSGASTVVSRVLHAAPAPICGWSVGDRGQRGDREERHVRAARAAYGRHSAESSLISRSWMRSAGATAVYTVRDQLGRDVHSASGASSVCRISARMAYSASPSAIKGEGNDRWI